MIGPRYTPAQIAAAFPPDSKVKKVPKKATGTKPNAEPIPEGEPPILGILRALGMTVAPAKDLGDGTGFRTTCPWASSHSDAVNDESGLLTIWPDGGPRHYLCRHSHCAERGLGDLVKLARERGIEVPVFGNRTLDDLASQARNNSGRPVILVCPPEVEVADASREALAPMEGVYARRGRLVHVHRHSGEDGKRTIPAGSVGIRDAGPAWVRERLSEAADFERATKTKDGFSRVASMVPDWAVSMILEAPGPGFRELRAVVTVPVICRMVPFMPSMASSATGCSTWGRLTSRLCLSTRPNTPPAWPGRTSAASGKTSPGHRTPTRKRMRPPSWPRC